jgi:glycine cleavage system H protein
MPDFIELTADKFIFRVATDRLYSSEGLWVLWTPSQEGNRLRIGLTDFLQQHSGDIAFVTVKPSGTRLQVGDDLAEIETIKVNLVLPSPVSGTLVAANEELELTPELVNQSPYDKGWLAEVDATGWEAARAALLDPKAYFAVMQSQVDQELKKS